MLAALRAGAVAIVAKNSFIPRLKSLALGLVIPKSLATFLIPVIKPLAPPVNTLLIPALSSRTLPIPPISENELYKLLIILDILYTSFRC